MEGLTIEPSESDQPSPLENMKSLPILLFLLHPVVELWPTSPALCVDCLTSHTLPIFSLQLSQEAAAAPEPAPGQQLPPPGQLDRTNSWNSWARLQQLFVPLCRSTGRRPGFLG